MSLSKFIEVCKTWCTFFAALIPICILFIITGISIILRKIVRALAFIFKRNELTQFAKGMDRIFFVGIDPEVFKTTSGTVNIVLVLKGSVELENVRKQIQALVVDYRDGDVNLVYARAQQFPTTWFGYDFYQWEKDFQIRQHVKYADGLTARSLNDYVPLRQNTPFEPKTSPWEVLLARNYDEAGNTGIYFRFHHSLCDGLNMIDLLNSRLSKCGSVEGPQVMVQNPNLGVNVNVKATSIFESLYNNIISLPRRFQIESASLRHLPPPDYHDVDLDCFVRSTNRINLRKLKQAKTKLGISLTAMLVTSMSSAVSELFTEDRLREYQTGYLTAMLTLMLPGSLNQKLGNSFGVTNLNIPTDPLLSWSQRIDLISAEFGKIRTSALNWVAGFMTHLTDEYPNFLHRKLALPPKEAYPGIVITNVPGCIDSSTFLDQEILDITVWPSTGLNAFWISFCVYSLKGFLKVSCMGAARVVGNAEALERICARVEAELRSCIAKI